MSEKNRIINIRNSLPAWQTPYNKQTENLLVDDRKSHQSTQHNPGSYSEQHTAQQCTFAS